MKQRILILKGLPASGKSTYAKQLLAEHPNVYKRINKDDLRTMLDDGQHSKGREQFILKARNVLIREVIESNMSPIIDDTNLNPLHETEVRKIAESYSPAIPVEVKEFNESVRTCIERDAKREKPVGGKVIRDMAKRWLPSVQKVLEQDTSLPRAIICDLDGTLAIIGDRSPYDASRCHEVDGLNYPVARIIRQYHQLGVHLIFMSGREEHYQQQTQWFLSKHFVESANSLENFSYHLIMRDTGDKRKDAIVKEELFNKHVRGNFYVELVLDDRDQVVEMWRDLGLTCFQVAPGDF